MLCALKNIVQNKKARHDYAVLERFEAGIELTGTEVKSCRAGSVSLTDAYAVVQDGQLILLNAHIAPYEQGNRNNHQPRRNRRLLMHKREILRLKKSVESKGLTLVPLSMYFNDRGKVKVDLALCRGKNVRDKREDIKKRSDDREIQRLMSARR
ncbi:MAG: SsrA-binding protein SmpB [Lentisphaerae bacterium]|jgi:SsrA-binding protein|nr:SsrA-binding protein SmpB [Lentisphaerota bacterium]